MLEKSSCFWNAYRPSQFFGIKGTLGRPYPCHNDEKGKRNPTHNNALCHGHELGIKVRCNTNEIGRVTMQRLCSSQPAERANRTASQSEWFKKANV